jgi:hypothetical protein
MNNLQLILQRRQVKLIPQLQTSGEQVYHDEPKREATYKSLFVMLALVYICVTSYTTAQRFH